MLTQRSNMAPEWPEEVDVFTVPHSRMKKLVHKYLDMVTSTNFSDVVHLQNLLENLCNTFHEFRAHERIENKYIMRKLKMKLRSLSITNTAVCNCHSDNRLSEMLRLVREGYTWTSKTARERINYGLQLRKALEDFTQQFLPHMEEEEEVFQPMLIKYFTYEELKEIKTTVIQQHQAQYPTDKAHAEKCVEDALSSESSDEEVTDVIRSQSTTFHNLPDEVVLHVLFHMSPLDLARCAQVCWRWNSLVFDPSLWTCLHPVQWAQGVWSFHPSATITEEEKETNQTHHSFIIDEDADVDESEYPEEEEDENQQYRQAHKEWRLLSGLVNYLLPRVGGSITHCSFAHSKGITNRLLQLVLMTCSNLQHLNLAYTPISDAAFKGLSEGCCCKLNHLDLTGCVNITDVALHRLSGALKCTHQMPHMDKSAENGGCYCEDVEGVGMQDKIVPRGTLPYTELKKWLICDTMLTDLIQLPSPSHNSDQQCCESSMYVKVSKASLIHYSSSDIRQLLLQVRKHFAGHRDREICDKCSDASGLLYLSLSGCYQITDVGLRSLSELKCATSLRFLDLSGCVEIKAAGLSSIVSGCQQLDHAQLFYCDNMANDPYATSASGCQNLECSSRFCCRFGD